MIYNSIWWFQYDDNDVDYGDGYDDDDDTTAAWNNDDYITVN